MTQTWATRLSYFSCSFFCASSFSLLSLKRGNNSDERGVNVVIRNFLMNRRHCESC